MRLPKFLDTFFDAFRSAPIMPEQPVGTTGVQSWSGYLYTPERNPDLVGTKRYTTYSELIANISIVGAAVRSFLEMICLVDWKIAPADDSDDAHEKAELVSDIIHDMRTPWFRVVRRAALARFYGFSIQEWTAKLRDDGVIGYDDIEMRPQHTIEQWDLDATGTLWGVMQYDQQTTERRYIPRRKCLYVVDDTLTTSPDGVGLMRHIIDDAATLRRYQQLEGFGFETDLRGVPLGRAPIALLNRLVADGKISGEQRDQALKGIRDFVAGHVRTPQLGILLDSMTYADKGDNQMPTSNKQWDMELLRTDSSSQPDINVAIDRKVHDIAMGLGATHLLIGASNKGSFAMAKEMAHAFARQVDSALTQQAWSMRTDLLDPLWAMNRWDPKMRPKLVPDAVQLRDVEELCTGLSLLAQAGAVMMPGDPAVNDIRRLMKVSLVPEVGSGMASALPRAPQMTPEEQKKLIEAANPPPKDPNATGSKEPKAKAPPE